VLVPDLLAPRTSQGLGPLYSEDSGAAHSMNAIYIYFAYIVATYLVGSELSRFQCLALTGMYSIFLTFPVFSQLTQIDLVTAHIQQFQAAYPELVVAYSGMRVAPPAYFYNLSIGIWVVGWILSLVFMLSKRRSKSDAS
jgi:hypothetical protein